MHRFVIAHPTTEQGVVDRALSKSYITSLSQTEQDEVVEKVRKHVAMGEGKVWINEEKGTFGKFARVHLTGSSIQAAPTEVEFMQSTPTRPFFTQ